MSLVFKTLFGESHASFLSSELKKNQDLYLKAVLETYPIFGTNEIKKTKIKGLGLVSIVCFQLFCCNSLIKAKGYLSKEKREKLILDLLEFLAEEKGFEYPYKDKYEEYMSHDPSDEDAIISILTKDFYHYILDNEKLGTFHSINPLSKALGKQFFIFNFIRIAQEFKDTNTAQKSMKYLESVRKEIENLLTN